MKRILILIALSILVFSNLKSQDNQKDSSVVLSERIIPDPSLNAVSREMINTIPLLRPPTMEKLMAYPKTEDEWKTFQRTTDSIAAINAQKNADAWSITIEKSEINGVVVRYVIPVEVDKDFENTWFIHVHGGAYVLNGGKAGTNEAVIIAKYLKVPIISIDYRMPPDYPFPIGLDDIVNAYEGIQNKYPKHKLVMGGTSAGGGLTISSIQQLIQRGTKLPSALFLGTPGSDLTKTGDSYYINSGLDRILGSYEGLMEAAVNLYANGEDLSNPLISPVYGNFSDFPPSFLISGTRDLLLSNTIRVDMKMRESGVITELLVIEAHSHGDYLLVHHAPESQLAFKDLGVFLKKYIKTDLNSK